MNLVGLRFALNDPETVAFVGQLILLALGSFGLGMAVVALSRRGR